MPNHSVTGPEAEPREFNCRITVLTNPLFYFLNRVFLASHVSGEPSQIQYNEQYCEKSLSSPLSIMYILSSLRISSAGKMKNRVENCGETAKDMMSPNPGYFTIQWEAHWKEELVWTGKLSETSLWRVSLPWVLRMNRTWFKCMAYALNIGCAVHPGTVQKINRCHLFTFQEARKVCLHSFGWK